MLSDLLPKARPFPLNTRLEANRLSREAKSEGRQKELKEDRNERMEWKGDLCTSSRDSPPKVEEAECCGMNVDRKEGQGGKKAFSVIPNSKLAFICCHRVWPSSSSNEDEGEWKSQESQLSTNSQEGMAIGKRKWKVSKNHVSNHCSAGRTKEVVFFILPSPLASFILLLLLLYALW